LTKEKKENTVAETPLMKQYNAIKAKYPDALHFSELVIFTKHLAKMPLKHLKYWELF